MTDTLGVGAADALMCARLTFLYGDLCLNTKTVAAIFGVSESDAAAAIKRHSVKWCHHVFGQLSRKTFLALSKVMGFDPTEIDADERHQWQAMTALLGREFLRLAGEGFVPWNEVDAFLERLPAVQAQAAARVTAPRLRFLYGDLGAKISEIMLILDASEIQVRRGLVLHEVQRHVLCYPELNDQVLDVLVKRLDLADWPNRWDEYTIDSRRWSAVVRDVREGLIRVANEGQLDLSAIDEFLAKVPAIAEEVHQARLAWLNGVATSGAEGAEKSAGA